MLAVSLAVSLAPIGQAKADSTSEIKQTSSITKQVDASRAIEHIRFLSETIGPRHGGTKSEEWASRYVGMQLKSMGYEVEYQPFKCRIDTLDLLNHHYPQSVIGKLVLPLTH